MNRLPPPFHRIASMARAFVFAFLAALVAEMATTWSALPAESETYPVRPALEGQRVAILPLQNGCSELAKLILDESGATSAELGSATAVLFAVDAANPPLARKYPGLQSLRAAAEQTEKACPNENGRVYLYNALGDGIVRTYMIVHHHCRRFLEHMFCSRPIPTPGRVFIKFAEDVEPGQIQSFIRDMGLNIHYTITDSRQRRYALNFPSEFLKSWIQIFLATPLIDEVSRDAFRVASVDAIRHFARAEVLEQRPGTPLSSKSLAIHAVDLEKRLRPFLNARYKAKGTITSLDRYPSFLSVKIAQLRGEVIVGDRFWEMLKANFVVTPSYDDRMRLLHLSVDGKFATGLGSRQPPEESYTSMEQKYFKNLYDYTQILATEAQKFLEKP